MLSCQIILNAAHVNSQLTRPLAKSQTTQHGKTMTSKLLRVPANFFLHTIVCRQVPKDNNEQGKNHEDN